MLKIQKGTPEQKEGRKSNGKAVTRTPGRARYPMKGNFLKVNVGADQRAHTARNTRRRKPDAARNADAMETTAAINKGKVRLFNRL